MKMSLRSAVLAISLISFFGCSKEKSFEEGGNSNGGNPPPTGDFRAKINGVQWIAADNARGASVIGGIINISGISSDNKQISITITGSSPGKYNLDQLSASVAAFVDGNSGNNFAYTTNQGTDTSMAGGVVNITEIDAINKTISGNFQFKVYRNMDSQQLLVTEGVFTKIPYVTSLPPASNSDSIFVKIDGVAWNPPSITASMSQGKLIIAGSELDASRTVALAMPQGITTGTYKMDFFAGSYFGEYNPDPATFLVSDTSGSLTILDINASTRRIKGTFQFPALDLSGVAKPAVLTEGYFSVGY